MRFLRLVKRLFGGEDRIALVKAASSAVDDLIRVSTRTSYGTRRDLIDVIRSYGVYTVPRLCMYATDGSSVGNQLIAFGVLGLIDPDGGGLKLAVAARTNPDPMVQRYSKYCASALFMGLREGKVPNPNQISLSGKERRTLANMLEELCDSDVEHPQLREMTRAALLFAKTAGLAQ